MSDDEWGFFIDLEFEQSRKKEKEKDNKNRMEMNNKINNLTVIYEEEYWHTRDDSFDYDYEEYNSQKIYKNDKDKFTEEKKKNNNASTAIYCIICCSLIYWSVTLS
jgi:hypothetical protein